MQRINYLDGHRGIAILLVVSFHAFARWPELLPYNNQFAEFPFFKYGYLGVQLFFLISGYVILMTLEKCQNIKIFLWRRWLRLFPAMLICSFFVFYTANFFIERPNGIPVAKDLIPGLTFIEPYIWQKITGISFNSIEGAFWSLYVEFKFYVIGAILFYLYGARWLVLFLFLCFLSSTIFEQIHFITDNKLVYYIYALTRLLSFEYFGWFAAGSAFYLFSKENEKKWFYIGLFISFMSSIVMSRLDIGTFMAIILISLFFAFSHISAKLQKMISSKILLFFGFVSYPLYLIHENMMISSIIKMSNNFIIIPDFIYPIISVIFLSIAAFFIAKFLEKPVKSIIVGTFDGLNTSRFKSIRSKKI